MDREFDSITSTNQEHPEEEEKIHENLLQVPSEELKREAFNQIVEGIVKDDGIEYSLNENQNVLVIKNGSGGLNYYLTTGVLSKKLPWKLLFRLIKNYNGEYEDWTSAVIVLIGKGVPKDTYDKGDYCENKIVNEEFYRVGYSLNAPFNLEVVKESSENLQLSDGPIEVSIDQAKGSLVFKSKLFEFRTDKLKQDEEYRIGLWLYGYWSPELHIEMI